MTNALPNLFALIERLGIDPAGATLSGRQAFVPRDLQDGPDAPSGFGPFALAWGKGRSHRVEEADPAHGELCFAVRWGCRLPRLLREPDAPAEAAFSYALPVAIELAEAERAFRRALMSGDRGAADEASWTKFRHSRAFAASPCTRDEYLSIKDEFLASDYVTGMGLGDYYEWWRESLAHVGPDGALSEASREKALALVDAWLPHNRDAGSLGHSTCRNIEPTAHPRHEPLFRALIDERLAETAPPSP